LTIENLCSGLSIVNRKSSIVNSDGSYCGKKLHESQSQANAQIFGARA